MITGTPVNPWNSSPARVSGRTGVLVAIATFAVICTAVFKPSVLVVILPFSYGLLFALTGFEVLVAFLQAFIFTILTAVYIGGSMHPEH